MAGRITVGDDYVLATGTAGAARLALVHQVYGPDAERIISGIGILKGGRIADIGCGTGNVARWFAHQVGQTGEVVALDVSAAQLAVARQDARQERINNVQFIEGDAYATKLPRDTFDVVHSRLVLCHLRRPIEALREMAALARPGGLVICCDLDMDGLASFPPTRSYDRMREIFAVSMRKRGLVLSLGLKLPRLFTEVGLPHPECAMIHPVFLRGEGKRLWEYTFMEGVEERLKSGAIKQPELDTLAIEWADIARDETIGVALARMPITWARKPG